jgi:hypothetical protein
MRCWDNSYRRFERPQCLNLQGQAGIHFALTTAFRQFFFFIYGEQVPAWTADSNSAGQ